MNQTDGLYVEVVTCCLLVLGKLLITELREFRKNFESQLFAFVLGSTCIFSLADIGWIIFSKALFPDVILANYTINCIYYVASAFVGFTWFIYCQYNIGNQISQKKLMMFFAMIPFFVLIFLSISAPVTKLLFYIDSENIYHRGKLHFVQVICLNCYFIFTCIQAIIRLVSKKYFAQRKKYVSICLFILWAFIAQLIQIAIPGYPTIEIGLTIALLSVYLEIKNSKITLDSLTQMNNKRQLLNFLSYKFSQPYDPENKKVLFLLLIDIDFFSELNGDFGHLEGDSALVLVSKSLKSLSAGQPYFLSRFEGDKFVLVCEKEDEKDIDKLCMDIKNTVSRDSKLALKDYELSVSVDYTKRDCEEKTEADFIKQIKNFTYNKKRARREV